MLKKHLVNNLLESYQTLQEVVSGGDTDYIPILMDLDSAINQCKYGEEVKLYYCQGFTMGEISDILDVSLGTVSYRVATGCSDIRDYLGGDYFDR